MIRSVHRRTLAMSTLASPTRALLLSSLIVSMLGHITHAAEHEAPKTDTEKIANAMSAAPPAVSRDATIAEMREDGSMKVLRQGTSEWTCVPDDPSSPGNDPMCLDPNAMEWLHALMTQSPSPPNKVGFIYMLQGGWDFS